jgi:hypothetical protein
MPLHHGTCTRVRPPPETTANIPAVAPPIGSPLEDILNWSKKPVDSSDWIAQMTKLQNTLEEELSNCRIGLAAPEPAGARIEQKLQATAKDCIFETAGKASSVCPGVPPQPTVVRTESLQAQKKEVERDPLAKPKLSRASGAQHLIKPRSATLTKNSSSKDATSTKIPQGWK